MRIEQIESALEEWSKNIEALEDIFLAYHAMTGADVDCELFKPAFEIAGAYTRAISTIVGDYRDYLEWYWVECGIGRSPHRAISASGLEIDSVDSVQKLAQLIHADQSKS